ncbi:undecaprenyl-diphosphate phosphatase, partial [Mesorhizobium sp. M3A.F.Ca.ET.201.01.1.1]|uniref:undecaprenyl-diphosphate phosphatase n=1 Tax=Mesorhizobium sp. M3A.F.Ca.ET.201.01.1.1 TaxID=2563946 RepID=UPI001093C623
ALAAVVSYFWSDIREVAVGSLAALARRDYAHCYFRLAVGIVLATVPIVIAGLALSSVLNACNSPLRGIAVIGLACIVMAVLLALSEIYASHRLTLDKVSVLDALLVGIAQVG